VFPAASIGAERGKNAIAFYDVRVKVRLHTCLRNSFA
jgi:hypothetical protein